MTKQVSRYKVVSLETVVDDGSTHVDDDPKKMAALFSAHSNALLGDMHSPMCQLASLVGPVVFVIVSNIC